MQYKKVNANALFDLFHKKMKKGNMLLLVFILKNLFVPITYIIDFIDVKNQVHIQCLT